MTLDPRERILTIRLMEKVKQNPACAKALGITIVNDRQSKP